MMELTKEWIDQFNKKCADFLNWGIISTKSGELLYKNSRTLSEYYIHMLRFHSDWNWIMEVVEAIQNTTNPKTQEDTTHLTLRLNIQANLGRVNKSKTIQAIDQFIDWYNKQKES